MKADIFFIKVDHCEPPHAVTHPDHLVELIESLRQNGWVGPPLIGYLKENRVVLLSGSHRFKAATFLEYKIPVQVYPMDYVASKWGDEKAWRSMMNTPLMVRHRYTPDQIPHQKKLDTTP